MPTLPLAVFVPSYIMAVVTPGERSAAAGIAGMARTTGAAISPFSVGLMFMRPALINVPFFIAGCVKIVDDLCCTVRSLTRAA
jgi:hypothetical protein